MTTPPLLTIKNLITGFNTRQGFVRAIDGIDFNLHPGETLALLGESGCGKSLTALSILQLLPLTAEISSRSEIYLQQHNLLNLSEVGMRHIRGNEIAMIFQEPMTSLNPVLTVGEQLSEILKKQNDLSRRQQQQRLLELLDWVGIPAARQRLKEYPHQLSGGMKQRIMIAIALAAKPRILIADEPTTALDVTIQAQILDLLKQLQRDTGMAILLITHDLGVVREMAQRVAVMYAGKIIEEATSELFFKQPLHPYSQKLFNALPDLTKRSQALEIIKGQVPALKTHYLGCRFANRCQAVMDQCHHIMPELQVFHDQRVACHLYANQQIHFSLAVQAEENSVSAGVLPQTLETTSTQTVHANDNVLQVSNLTIHFPIYRGLFKRQVNAVKAVDGIHLALARGKTLALVGESGCGKTTIGKSIVQLLTPNGGIICLNGKNLNELSRGDRFAMRKELQIIFQDPVSSMDPRMMVGDIISEGLKALKLESDPKKIDARVDDLLQQVGLNPEAKYRYPHEFSGGQRQRICIARALAVKPSVIVCDEPTSALDVSVQAQILNLLKSLQQEFGLSYLFITHNISVVAYLADEIAVMYLGRIVEYGHAEKILNHPQHPYTQALLQAVPSISTPTQPRIKLSGELPSPINPPPGCYFHPRCKHALPTCRESYPPTIQQNGSKVSCWLYQDG
ncbi:MAG: ABC transporter ATP-binding protein [Legionellales bacterium]|nr:ABC transporter ATP-binding protein [Legionellales bacterium]